MKKLLRWLYNNSANILSASRILTPLILFWPGNLSIREKLTVIIFLAITDIFDGFLARKIGNEGKAGKFIDSFSDKVLIFSVLAFLYLEKIVNPKIVGALILGELLAFSIAVYGICLVWEKNRGRWIKNILEHWKVNAPGKLAMVFYFFMAIFIFISVIFPRNEIWAYFYLISFWGGLIFRVISIGYYVVDLNNWQKEYNKTL